MSLLTAIEQGDLGALRAAVAAGEVLGAREFAAVLAQGLPVLKALLELKAVPFKQGEHNVLNALGHALRQAYPNAARLKRAKNPDWLEPPVIVALRQKAALLIEAGAEVDFEVAVRLGLTERVEAMLLKNPALAKQRLSGASAADVAAQSGAWGVSRLLRASAKAGFVFDWAAAEQTVLDWAAQAVASLAAAAEGLSFRRLAFDFDAEGTLVLSADSTDGNAHAPADYSHPGFADFARAPRGEAVLAELERTAAPQRFLQLLSSVALSLETHASTKQLKRGMRFSILVFDRHEEEPAALLRQKSAKRAAQ
jgi:hypothetical protein